MKALVVLSIAVLVVLSGCAESKSGNGGTDGHVTQDNYDPANCSTLLPSTGPQANFSEINVEMPVTSAYFGKRYNRAMLQGVLNASGVQTEKFIVAENIYLAKIPYGGVQAACLYQHDLPIAPAWLKKEWDKEAGGDHGGGHLDGLFNVFRDGTETIMVREDSSRWTLVHEMMHANFYRQRERDGVPGSAQLTDLAQSSYAQLSADSDLYKKSLSKNDLAKVVADTNAVANLRYQALVSGSLEEIADESLLLEEWAAGRLQNVAPSSAKNAAWYIDYSRTLSLQDLNDFSATIIKMRDDVIANPPRVADPSDALSTEDIRAQFQKPLDFITSINQNTADLAQKAKERTASLDISSHITLAASVSVSGYAEMTNAHLVAMNNTPALREFRRQNAAFLAKLAH